MKATPQGQDIAGRLDRVAGRLMKVSDMSVRRIGVELSELINEIYVCVDKVYRLDERGRKR